MTRHAAYAVSSTGRQSRHPFASFPHADAARRWAEAHPSERVRFVPALPEDAPETLGACGCTDYHLADCPTRTGGTFSSAEGVWAAEARRQAREDDGWDA